MPANFSVSPRRPEWVEGARVIVDLAITNTGDAPIALPNPSYASSPQPTYIVVRPDGEEIRFVPDVRGGTVEIGMIEIAPGATWRGDLCPGSYVPLDLMGEYTIAAELQWNGVEAVAEAQPFRIVPLRIEDVSASISQAADGFVVLECALLQRAQDGGLRALAALLEEDDPSNGEMREPDLQDRGPLSAGTTKVYGALANYSTGLDATRWIVSRTPDAVHVGTNLDSAITTLTSARPVRRLVTALAVKGPSLFLPAITAEGITHELVFARVDRQPALPPSVAMRPVLRLQGMPRECAACLGPERTGPVFVVAMLQDTDAGGRVQLVQIRPDGGTRVQQGMIEGVVALGGLAVHWSTDGRIRTAFLGRFAAEGQPTGPQLLEFEFDETLSTHSSVTRRIPVRHDAPIERVVLRYFERRPREVRRALVFQGNGASWFVKGARPAQRVPLPADVPFELVPGDDFWYAVWAADGKLVILAL
jgi:hypothetical protein